MRYGVNSLDTNCYFFSLSDEGKQYETSIYSLKQRKECMYAYVKPAIPAQKK